MKLSVTEILNQAVKTAFPDERELPPVFIETPRDKGHGDYAANIAMTLAPIIKKSPREIAGTIIDNISDTEAVIKKVDIAGPGFINFILSEKYWTGVVNDIIEKNEHYGNGNIGNGEKVNIEYVSANPTGPLHIGHGRGAVVGDALARILAASGFDVTKEYYINDAGVQINNLGSSINYRMHELRNPDLPRDIEFPESGYHGDYIKDVAEELSDSEVADVVYGLSPQEAIDLASEAVKLSAAAGTKLLLGKIRSDLEKFGITFDVWFSEKTLHESGKIADLISSFEKEGLIYKKDGASWFNSTRFGDEKDRVVVKEDGNLTYLAADMAYHRDKLLRGYDRIIDVWGADHHGYISRVRGAIEAMGFSPEKFNVLLIQMVSLVRGGKPVSMSKRSGNFVTLEDVINEVGTDAARFFFLMRRYDSQLEFDLDLAKKQTADNPVFYIQYMNARICSILRNADNKGITLPSPHEANLTLLELREELEIIKLLASFPELVEAGALAMEPHRLTVFLQNLATAFHSYYNKTRVITDDKELTLARLSMVDATRIVVTNALKLLGISVPERM